jgi:two-component sensor histidine kinase
MREPSHSAGDDPSPARLSTAALAAELDHERARAREIDHRARNTLQLVSSLVVLQSRRAQAPETRQALQKLHQRIGAVTAVHRGFLPAARPDRFDFSGFVREQMNTLAQNAPSTVRVELDLEPVETRASAAAPLALILGELAANALAHACAEGRPMRLCVRLNRAGELYALTVEDDGPGLPADAESRGFGLTLVKLMCQQLDARLVLDDAQPGLRAVVTGA